MALRAVTLARTAADAEVLLIRREVNAAVRRAAYAAVGAVFGLGALVLLHVLAYVELRTQFAWATPPISTLVVLAFDVIVTVVFLVLASRSADPVADELRALRNQCVSEMKRSLGSAAALSFAGRFLGRKQIYGVVLAALTARFLGRREA
jgi:uncharacterized membrane protein